MTEEEFRKHKDGKGSPEETREFFHMFMNKACGVSANEADDLLRFYAGTLKKPIKKKKVEDLKETPTKKQEEKIILNEDEYEVL